MKLIDQPMRVVLLAYSFWAQALGILALILPEAIYYFFGVDIDPAVLWWLSVGLLLFGLLGRLVQQTGSAMRNALKIAAVAALILLTSLLAAQARGLAPQPSPALAASEQEAKALAIAVPFIARWEGIRNEAYIPVPGDVPTICFGSTRGVYLGMRKSDAECLRLLLDEVREYRSGVLRYLTAETRARRLPPTRDAAWTSFAYNVGTAAAGKSTATRRLNAGDVAGACEALTWWNRAGGRVIRGLVARRAEERDLCLA